MKVTRLKVQNIKGLREIEIHADPTVNEIAGENGAGKSSALDSIVFALAGKRVIDEMPIREGERKAEIVLETDDLVITRRFKGDGTTLTVRGKDGGRYGQRRLDQLFSGFTFDPLAFSRLKPADQIEHLKHLAGPDFRKELGAIEADIIDVFDRRKDANQRLKTLGKVVDMEREDPVNVSDILTELDEVEKHNDTQRRRQGAIERADDMIELREEQVDELAKKLTQAKAALKEAKKARFDLKEVQPLRDPDDLKAKISAADVQNRKAEAYKIYCSRLEQRKEVSAEADFLTEKLEDLRDKRLDMMGGDKFPVEGVAFVNDALVINGIPFDQLSSSERIRVSARIGMAAASELKIMFIRDGSLLDGKSFYELAKLAEQSKYQLWVETVGNGHGDAIVLEEGEIRDASDK